jgi:tRNA 5-methylaminomethyl-2-thiouridine biosynthesis bifunctional protein
VRFNGQGLVQVATTSAEEQAMAETLAALGYPPEFATLVSRAQASSLSGNEPLHGGWFYPRAGWIDPRSLCAAQLDNAGTDLHRCFGQAVERLAHHDGSWHAIGAAGQTLASAPVVIIANAGDAARLAGLRYAPTRSARGQLSFLPADASAALRMPLIGDGYLVPLSESSLMTGASYDLDDPDPALRHDSHADNLARLGQLVPALADRFDPGTLAGRVAFRCVASDRLPLIGQLADETAAAARATELAGAWPLDLPRQHGLYCSFGYGSRGLLWAALGAELIAAQINGEPWPIERDLADGIDPARFLQRALRHGQVGRPET